MSRMSAKTCFVATVIALGSITCFVGPPARALTQQQIDWCGLKGSPTNDQQIDGCTAFIQSNWYIGDSLAAAFYNRGNAYSRKGQYDLAIRDFD